MLFFLFLVMLSNFWFVPDVRAKLAFAISTEAPATLIKEMLDTPPLVALKTIKNLSMQSKAATYLLNFLLHDFL